MEHICPPPLRITPGGVVFVTRSYLLVDLVLLMEHQVVTKAHELIHVLLDLFHVRLK